MLSFSDLFFTEEEEIDYLVSLYDMATVGWDSQKGFLMQVNPSEQYIGGDYFKLYNHTSEKQATKIARINFVHPIYTIHAPKWNRGKDYWLLNTKEKRKLMEFLKAQNTNHPKYSNWKYAILEFNKGKGLTYKQTKSNRLSNEKLDFPNAIPYDLKIPNYLDLPAESFIKVMMPVHQIQISCGLKFGKSSKS